MKKLLFFASAVAMLASCSKDFTEEVGVSAPEGKVKIVARVSMEEETTTRTHIDDLTRKYAWDNGDAIGVFVATNGDASNAYFGYTGTGNDFTGDYLPALGDAKGYYGYYPWDRGATLKNTVFDPEGQNLTMYINAKQKYNRTKSSFAATEAPAVAYSETLDEKKVPELNFIGLAAYIKIKVYGIGEIRSLKLKVNGEKVKDAALNGEFVVDMSTLPEIFEANEGKAVKDYTYPDYAIVDEGMIGVSEAQKEITLDLGSETVNLNLDPTKNEDFWFVVPAGLEFAEGDSIDFFVNDDDKASFTYTFKVNYTTKSNTIANLCQKSPTEDNPLVYVADNATLISEPEDLLWYLYFVNHGETSFENYGSAYPEFFEQNQLKPAFLTKDIAFYENGVAAEGIPTRLYADEYQQLGDAEKALYDWYVHPVTGGGAEYYINSIGAKSEIDEEKHLDTVEAVAGWTIKGYGEGVTISGLTIKGNGVFATEGASNITLKAFTVDASEVEEGENIHFLYETLLDGVTIGADCQLVGTKGALIDEVNTEDGVEIPEGLVFPTDEKGEEIAFAYTLNINGDITWADYKEYNFVKKQISKDGALVTVADKAGAEEFFATEIDTEAVDYYSVVDETTSYWTGLTATAVTEDDYFTAEELALVVKNRKAEKAYNITMTNDIDLMGDLEEPKAWPIVKETAAFTIDGAGEYTISNINIDGTTVEEQTATSSLMYTTFGSTVNAKNLTLKNVVITVKEGDKAPHIAAVANTPGSATTNVTVDGLKITTTVACADGIGGLFGTTTQTSATAGTYNYLKNCTIKNVDVTGVAEGLAYGDLAGKFTITVGGVEALTVSNDGAAYENKPFGSIVATVGTTKISGEDITPEIYEPAYKSTKLDFVGFEVPVKNGDIVWAAQNSTTAKQYNLKGFTLFVTNDAAGEWYMIHE